MVNADPFPFDREAAIRPTPNDEMRALGVLAFYFHSIDTYNRRLYEFKSLRVSRKRGHMSSAIGRKREARAGEERN